MADVLAVAIRDVDRAIAFAPECPTDGSIVAIGSHPNIELIQIRRCQVDPANFVADDVLRGINGTTPRHWTAGTPWRYVSCGSAGTSTPA